MLKGFDIHLEKWHMDHPYDHPYVQTICLHECKNILGINYKRHVKHVPIYSNASGAYKATFLTMKHANLAYPEKIDIVSAYAQASLYTTLLENDDKALSDEKRQFYIADFLKTTQDYLAMRDIKELVRPVKDARLGLYALKDEASELFTKKIGASYLEAFDQRLDMFYKDCHEKCILN